MSTQPSRFWALLIGIDYYMANETEEGIYRPLIGCVSDVRRIEQLLAGIGPALNLAQVITLTASGHGPKPAESPEHWPTYANIVAALKQLRDTAAPGDQLYIHASCHGCRARTIFPELKGAGGYDEGLVPVDIGVERRYLRDVELAYLLQGFVERGLLVTVTLDSCHSAGAVRAPGVRKRGLDQPDERPDLPRDSLVAPREELEALWAKLQSRTGGLRNAKQAGGWLPPQRGYTLLAACGEAEFANEYSDDGVPTGALTRFFLDGCKRLGRGFTYKLLLDHILAGIHGRFPSQTPQLQGDGDRVVFGVDTLPTADSVPVLRVEDGRALLNTGQASGVAKGATFAVYPPGTLDFSRSDTRVACAEIVELGATDSWARLTPLDGREVVVGAQALLLDAGNLELVRSVRLIVREEPGCAAGATEQRARLQEVAAALEDEAARSRLKTVVDGDTDFQVTLSDDGLRYEVWDRAGTLIALRPPVEVCLRDAAARVVQRLIHLAKYRNVHELRNFDTYSLLEGKLRLELIGRQQNYELGQKPHPAPFDDPNQPAACDDEYVFLRVTNLLPPVNDPEQPWLNTLNVTLFDLAPDWSISQVFPPDDSPFVTLAPGQRRDIPLHVWLPTGYNEGVDTFKVFATEGSHTTRFRWFTLPALDRPTPVAVRNARTAAATSSSPLDRMLASVGGEQPTVRNSNVTTSPSEHWATAQVELRLTR